MRISASPPRKHAKPSSEALYELRHHAAELEVGETRRYVCFFCGGGSTTERSLCITRESYLTALYTCHRANCGVSGMAFTRVYSGMEEIRSDTIRPHPAEFTPRLFTGDTRELGERSLSFILGKYGLTGRECSREGWCETIEEECLVCPIYGPDSVRRGVEVRNIFGYSGHPKTSSFRECPGPWVGWFGRGVTTGPVVAVEDALSALKVSRQYRTASLMGSHLGEDHILDLRGVLENGGFSNQVILALDRDAFDKAVKYAQKWAIYVNFRPILLSKDMKYLDDGEIKQLVEG